MSDSADDDSKDSRKPQATWADVAIEALRAVKRIGVDGHRVFYQHVKDFQPSDRLRAQRAQLGPLKLRLRKLQLTFSGFLALCVTSVLIVGLVMRPEVRHIIINQINQITNIVRTADPHPTGNETKQPTVSSPSQTNSKTPEERLRDAAETPSRVINETVAANTPKSIPAPSVPSPTEPPKKPSDTMPPGPGQAIVRAIGL